MYNPNPAPMPIYYAGKLASKDHSEMIHDGTIVDEYMKIGKHVVIVLRQLGYFLSIEDYTKIRAMVGE